MQLEGALLGWGFALPIGTSTLGHPGNWLRMELHQESVACSVDKLGLSRSWRETGGFKVLEALMLCGSTGSWRPVSHLGKAVSCCQVDPGAEGSLNGYPAHPTSTRAEARWG